jgi:hypothetical protein
MLTTTTGNDTRAMNDVVRILKSMPLDKQKKILKFKAATSENWPTSARDSASPVATELLRNRASMEGNETNAGAARKAAVRKCHDTQQHRPPPFDSPLDISPRCRTCLHRGQPSPHLKRC